ncbi:MAG: hypothetical protein KIT68_00470 [Phycisphaeraceae bacterium]|nr:hypothetical protein [Phycisphaeraceae bacterium]
MTDRGDTSLTWAGLLAQWMALARATARLPAGPENDRWRSSAPSIIGLHALTCALGDLDRLPAAERSAALDTAAVSIDRHEGLLRGLWSGAPLPGELEALAADARAAWVAASRRARSGES